MISGLVVDSSARDGRQVRFESGYLLAIFWFPVNAKQGCDAGKGCIISSGNSCPLSAPHLRWSRGISDYCNVNSSSNIKILRTGTTSVASRSPDEIGLGLVNQKPRSACLGASAPTEHGGTRSWCELWVLLIFRKREDRLRRQSLCF